MPPALTPSLATLLPAASVGEIHWKLLLPLMPLALDSKTWKETLNCCLEVVYPLGRGIISLPLASMAKSEPKFSLQITGEYANNHNSLGNVIPFLSLYLG